MNSHAPLVVFNAHLLGGNASYRSAGISVYIANLLRCFGARRPDVRFQVLAGSAPLPEGASLPVLRSRMQTERPWQRIAWEQSVLPVLLRRLRADLLHAPAFVGPLLSSVPQVITVHDLSFLRYPAFFRPGNRLYLSTFTGMACRRADAVIAVSEFTAREVVELLGVPRERVVPIYHGVAPRFRPLPAAAVADFRRAHGLPDRFVLFMGTLEPRKNLIRLVRAFARLGLPELHLIIAGAQGWYYHDIFAEVERLQLADRVHFPGFVAVDDQALWYNAACAFAYVSIYEGFGMPVLEALACGTPTLTSNTSSLPEAGGDAVLTCPPDDEEAMADALHRLVSDVALQEALRVQGLGHAGAFSWEATARQTIEVYQRIIHKEEVA